MASGSPMTSNWTVPQKQLPTWAMARFLDIHIVG
jgi:hypothetical protein